MVAFTNIYFPIHKIGTVIFQYTKLGAKDREPVKISFIIEPAKMGKYQNRGKYLNLGLLVAY